MYTMRDFLGLFIGAAITAACFVFLLPPDQCPWGVLPATKQELALGNATHQPDLRTNKLDTVRTSSCIACHYYRYAYHRRLYVSHHQQLTKKSVLDKCVAVMGDAITTGSKPTVKAYWKIQKIVPRPCILPVRAAHRVAAPCVLVVAGSHSPATPCHAFFPASRHSSSEERRPAGKNALPTRRKGGAASADEVRRHDSRAC
jgi:hypothetical protein